MHKLNFELPKRRVSCGSLLKREDSPSLGQWELLIARALFEIEEELLEKVVLARKTHFLSDKPFHPLLLLEQLQQRAHLATVFGFQLSPDAAFIGATPELLYQREGRLLYTEALAGTRPRGENEEENLRIQEELLTNPKDKREFAFVKQFIHAALAPLSTEMHWDPYDRVVPTTHVQHIHNRLQATLLPDIADRQLIETLHPTPALGGKPRAHALQFLQDQEPFNRGWYGAPIGWISGHAAEIAVGIRPAFVHGKEIELFAGTGIVKGSQALKEWEELEHKITPFKQIFS
jgi:menaquinone-specific isochorismate synthase